MGRFQGKRILITGGTSGMGLTGVQRIVTEDGHVALMKKGWNVSAA